MVAVVLLLPLLVLMMRFTNKSSPRISSRSSSSLAVASSSSLALASSSLSVSCPRLLLNGVEFRCRAHEQHAHHCPSNQRQHACLLTSTDTRGATPWNSHHNSYAPQALRASAPRRASSVSRCRSSSRPRFWSMQTDDEEQRN